MKINISSIVFATFMTFIGCKEPSKTIAKGQVLDYFTKKPIDSLVIRISDDIDGDIFWETMTNEKGEFSYEIADSLAASIFQVTVRPKGNYYYLYDKNENSPIFSKHIEPRQVNEFALLMRPACTIKVEVHTDSFKDANDSMELAFYRETGYSNGVMSYTRPVTGKENPSIHYWTHEGNIKLKAQWIIHNGFKRDTFYRDLITPLTDTIDFRIDW